MVVHLLKNMCGFSSGESNKQRQEANQLVSYSTEPREPNPVDIPLNPDWLIGIIPI